jgi:TonB-dependent SusC/RagA subfamily outer membrane receptor
VGVPDAGASPVRARQLGATGEPQPLYIIDGEVVPATDSNPLARLNPSQVESISVLKDASATEQYGARGVNGVVIIGTRRGLDGVTVTPEEGRRASGIASVSVSENGMTRAEFDAALAKVDPAVSIWVVDGARADRAAALAIDPAQVLRVLIGTPTPALREAFGAEAENGIVQIATKARGGARSR